MNRIEQGVSSFLKGTQYPQPIKQLAKDATLVSISKGEYLFATGDACENFVLVVSGRVRVQLTTRSGREVILFRLEPGQACALTTACLLQNTSYYAAGIAETDVVLIAIPAKVFQKTCQTTPELMVILLSDFATRISGLTQLVDRLTSRNIDNELTGILLSAVNSSGVVQLTHQKIANELGTAREVVSRHLKELERLGIIELKRGSVLILDQTRLQIRTT